MEGYSRQRRSSGRQAEIAVLVTHADDERRGHRNELCLGDRLDHEAVAALAVEAIELVELVDEDLDLLGAVGAVHVGKEHRRRC